MDGGIRQQGVVSAVTLVTPVRRRHRPALWFIFLVARWTGWGWGDLRRLRLVLFLDFSVVRRLGGRDLGRTHLMFQSNFNGGMLRYLDCFADVLGWRMDQVWKGDPEFPGTRAGSRYHAYVLEHTRPVLHYATAYPDVSAREVERVLGVAEAVEGLRARVEGSSDAEFRRLYDAALREVDVLL